MRVSRKLNAKPSGSPCSGRATQGGKASGKRPDYARSNARWVGDQGDVLRTATCRQPNASSHYEPSCQAHFCHSGWCQLKSVFHAVTTHGPYQTIRSQDFRAQRLLFSVSRTPCPNARHSPTQTNPFLGACIWHLTREPVGPNIVDSKISSEISCWRQKSIRSIDKRKLQ